MKRILSLLAFAPLLCAETPRDLPPAVVDLSNGKAFVFEKMAGKCEESTWESFKRPDGTDALSVNYRLLETDPTLATHPDWKARDAFGMVAPVNLDLSGQSWFAMDVKGDGTQHGFSVTVIDDQNRGRILGTFGLVDKEWRTYSCDLRSVSDNSNPEIDLSKIRKVKIALTEAHKFEIPHVGTASVANLTFSNQRRQELLEKNRAWLGGFSPDGKSFEAAEKSVLDEKLRKLETGSGFATAVELPQNKVNKDLYRMLSKPGAEISLSSARNEAESAQLLVIPTKAALKNVKVELEGSLTHADGKAQLSPQDITINPVGYVNCTPTYTTFYEELGSTPDPLLPPGAVEKVEVGEVQPFYVTVSVPADAAAGNYTGSLKVSAEGIAPQTVKLALKVYDFTLPVTHHLSRQYYYWLSDTARWYDFIPASTTVGGNGDGFGMPLELIKEHLDFLLKRRIDIANMTWPAQVNKEYCQPAWPLRRNKDKSGYDFSTFDEVIDFCLARGMSEFSIGDSPTPFALQPNAMEILKAAVAHLKSTNRLQYAHYKVKDEPSNKETFDIVKTQLAELKASVPELKTLATLAEIDPEVLIQVDKVVLRCPDLSPEIEKQIKDAKKDVWWYWCAYPGSKPAPNYFVNYPGTDPRVIEWLNWKYQVKGNLYWGLNVWGKNCKPVGEKRWPEIPWNPNSYANFNGDGQLVYPGPDGKLLSSLRFEAIRDGAEDYEYFYLLQSLIAKMADDPKNEALIKDCERALTLDGVVQDLYHYTDQADVVQGARNRIAELIVKANQRISVESSEPDVLKTSK